jgi:thiamine-monophosphate kinase
MNYELPPSEQELIEKIRRRFPAAPGVRVGIGDDAAVLERDQPIVITTDLLIEGIDFPSGTAAGFIGRKALAANLSDLAAMGAAPDVFLLSLGWPASALAEIDDLIEGLAGKAAASGISLVGGDLSSAPQRLVSITAIGTLGSGRELLRSGARPGDLVYVSRPVGGAAAGLALLLAGWRLQDDGTATPPDTASWAQRELVSSLLRAQLDPEAEVELGPVLAAIPQVRSCIDVSDGLSRDLPRICDASGVGAVVEWERIPLVPDLERGSLSLRLDAARCALHGGEEYSLLFTSSLRESEMSQLAGRPVYQIGRVTAERGVRLLRGASEAPLEPLGFDHFQSGSPSSRPGGAAGR